MAGQLRVCVFGAGAIGGHLAGRLVRGGAAVSVVARGAHLAAMRERGIEVHAPDASFTAKVTAAADASALGVQDVVLVTVKAPSLPSVAAGIAPLLGPATKVAFVMNGIPWWYCDGVEGVPPALRGRRLEAIDPGEAVRRAVGVERTIGGVVYSACTVVSPGVVEVEHARNRLVLARNRLVVGAPDDRPGEMVEALAAVLRAGGFQVDVVSDIRSAVWTKLVLNLGTGPLCVLTQSPPCDVLGDPALEAVLRAVHAEGLAIARALGCAPEADVERAVANARAMGHRPSILQDLELGRKMEVDALYAVPLQLARLAGVAMPVLDVLVPLVVQRARAAGLYG